MNIQLLIDSIVRQMTILIAQLATAGGARAPLAHIANRVFLDLAKELQEQGIGRKVSADMFGLALRSYQRKIQRLSESATHRGRSLWEAVFDYLHQHQTISRAEVLRRFHRDDDELVRGVLHDLTENGLVFQTGKGARTVYRVATEEEIGQLGDDDEQLGLDAFLWALVYRSGPVTRDELANLASQRPEELDPSLDRLVSLGRIARDLETGEPLFHCDEFLVPLGEPTGWEAAVFDHFQAMVQTICQRLDRESGPSKQDIVGGSTYTFDVWDGHPLAEEVYGTLGDLRQRLGDLRARVEAVNADSEFPRDYESVVVYGGQAVMPRERSAEETDD